MARFSHVATKFQLRTRLLSGLSFVAVVGCAGERFGTSSDGLGDVAPTSATGGLAPLGLTDSEGQSAPPSDVSEPSSASDAPSGLMGVEGNVAPTSTQSAADGPAAPANPIESGSTMDPGTKPAAMTEVANTPDVADPDGAPSVTDTQDAGVPVDSQTVDDTPPEVSDTPDSGPEVVDAPRECPEHALLGPDEHCYLFGAEEVVWSQAREECQDLGDDWDLAVVSSQAEHEWISSQLDQESWVAGRNVGGEWIWVTSETPFWVGRANGEAIDNAYTQWEEGEPSAGIDSSQCLRYSDDLGDWFWTDVLCTREFGYVCEQPPPEAN